MRTEARQRPAGRGASPTEIVIVSKCGKDQESSLCPSGMSSKAPAAATFTFDPITAFPPPIVARIGFPSIGWTHAPPCSISPLIGMWCFLGANKSYRVSLRLKRAISNSSPTIRTRVIRSAASYPMRIARTSEVQYPERLTSRVYNEPDLNRHVYRAGCVGPNGAAAVRKY